MWRFVQNRFEQDELKEGCDVPQLADSKGFELLQCADECLKGERGEISMDGVKVQSSGRSDARLISLTWQNNARKLGHFPGLGGDSCDCGTQESRVRAQLKQDPVIRSE